MKPHKWAKEIKAWADGAEIEFRDVPQDDWKDCGKFGIGMPTWDERKEYRIKPQPKKPQYLYVYEAGGKYEMSWIRGASLPFHCGDRMIAFNYFGKIQVEKDDENN